MPTPGAADPRHERLLRLALVAVTDRHRTRGDPVAAVAAAVRGGATAVLLRDRDLARPARRSLARTLRRLTRAHGALLLVHDDAALARAVDADGIHVAADGDPVAARAAAGPERLVTTSAHDAREIDRASGAPVDAILYGNVWATRSHPGRAGRGAAGLRRAIERSRVPVLAVGGVTPRRLRGIRGTGLAGVAVIDALLAVADPAAAAGELLAALCPDDEGAVRPPAPGGSDERALVAAFLAAADTGDRLTLGPGDDAVVLRPDGTTLATDLTVAGVHYEAGAPARRVGWKAAARALSDLAAVGAEPIGLMAGLALPRGTGRRRALGLGRGLREAAAAVGARVLGGDTKETPGAETLAVTAVGRVKGRRPPLARGGGAPGDVLFVTGPLGGSLVRGRHLRIEARIEAGRDLRRRGLATACIDISDGLSTDLHRLCRASGTGAWIEAWRVPIHPDARRAAALDGRPALDHALHDGEDHELLFAAPAARAAGIERTGVAGAAVRRIGRLVDPGAGVVMAEEDGYLGGLRAGGWVHLRPDRKARP